MDKVFYTKFISRIVYVVLPIVLILLSFFTTNAGVFNLFGQIAILALVFTLFIKPLSVIFKYKLFSYFISIRRQLGITVFWFFVFHAGGMILNYGLRWKDFSSIKSFLFWGMLAGIGMLVLGLTSNKYATNFLKKNWKVIQYISYPTLFFALWHGSLAQDEIEKFYIVVILFIVLKIWQIALTNYRKNKKFTVVS